MRLDNQCLLHLPSRSIGGRFIESEKAGFAVIHVENGRIAEIKRIDMA